MLVPIRCMQCGRAVADKWATYERQLKEGVAVAEIFDRFGWDMFRRHCCRATFMTASRLADQMIEDHNMRENTRIAVREANHDNRFRAWESQQKEQEQERLARAMTRLELGDA